RFTNFVPGLGAGSVLANTPEPYGQNDTNFQPRVGFAWNVLGHGNTVLRGGYGFQVDQPISGVVTGLNSNPPFNLPLSVPVAAGTALGNLPGLFNGAPVNVAPLMVNPNFKNANVQSWNLNLEQQLGRSIGLTVGYFGAKGTHLEIDRDINQFTVLGGAASTR